MERWYGFGGGAKQHKCQCCIKKMALLKCGLNILIHEVLHVYESERGIRINDDSYAFLLSAQVFHYCGAFEVSDMLLFI